MNQITQLKQSMAGMNSYYVLFVMKFMYFPFFVVISFTVAQRSERSAGQSFREVCIALSIFFLASVYNQITLIQRSGSPLLLGRPAVASAGLKSRLQKPINP